MKKETPATMENTMRNSKSRVKNLSETFLQ